MEPLEGQKQITRSTAWQPLTFKGAARFSQASFTRLVGLFLVTSALGGLLVAWFVSRSYLPIIDQAVSRLPDQVELNDGQLSYGGEEDLVLAQNNHLAIVIGTEEPSSTGHLADLQWELRRREVWMGSLFGYLKWAYPDQIRVPLDRLNAEPWWKARRPYVLAGVMVAITVGLPLLWTTVAAFLAGPIWLWTWLLRRQVTLMGCGKMAGAALIPGSLWLGVALIAYALQGMNLVGLVVLFALHGVVDLVYLVMAPVFVPLNDSLAAEQENPFARSPVEKKSAANPFRP